MKNEISTIKLELDVYSNRYFEGIDYENVAFVRIFIDEEDILEKEWFEGSVVYWYHLYESHLRSGKYLIFTCACGIADCGGCDYIDVNVNDELINWNFEDISYTFRFSQYKDEVLKIDEVISKLDSRFNVEPSVIFLSERDNG